MIFFQILFLSNCSSNSFTVEFDSLGGTQVETQTVKSGDSANLVVPSRVGYTFSGWFSDNTFMYEYTQNSTISMDIVLYAKWQVNSYTISFEENGGSEVSEISLSFGSEITLPNSPLKSGSTFLGWYTDSEFTQLFSESSMGSENLIVYAKWQLNNYTIHFEENGGSLVEDISQAYDTIISIPSVPIKEGFTFLGWYTDISYTQQYNNLRIRPFNETVYASWQINYYTISFEENGGSIVQDIIQSFNSVILFPGNPIKDGYTFGGWFEDEELTHEFTISRIQSTNQFLYAKWLVNSYSLSFQTNGSGNVESIILDFGLPISLPNNPVLEGYSFLGWYIDYLLTTPFVCETMPSHNIVLYAAWSDHSFISVLSNNEEVGVYSGTGYYPNGSNINITASSSQSDFYGWYNDDVLITLDNTISFTLEHDVTLYAKWDYYIYNSIDLQNMIIDPYGSYVIKTDINMSDINWVSFDFHGVLNGSNYKIENLSIINQAGMFNSNVGDIFDLILTNCELTSTDAGDYSIGLLVGINIGNITDVVISGEITYSKTFSAYGTNTFEISIGGLVGQNRGTITLSSVDVDITSFIEKIPLTLIFTNQKTKEFIGGLVGFSSGVIVNSYSKGTISANAEALSHKVYIGGLVGYLSSFELSGDMIIDMTYTTVSIFASNTRDDSDSKIYACGLVGYQVVGHISNSFTSSSIIIQSGSDSYVSDITQGSPPSTGVTKINTFRIDNQTLIGSVVNNNGDTVSLAQITNNSWIFEVLGWSSDIWNTESSINEGFPILE